MKESLTSGSRQRVRARECLVADQEGLQGHSTAHHCGPLLSLLERSRAHRCHSAAHSHMPETGGLLKLLDVPLRWGAQHRLPRRGMRSGAQGRPPERPAATSAQPQRQGSGLAPTLLPHVPHLMLDDQDSRRRGLPLPGALPEPWPACHS